MGLKEDLRKELVKSTSLSEIKQNLLSSGYLESDVDYAIRSLGKSKDEEKSKNNSIFSYKEFLDRLGHGFASQQFINILFLLSDRKSTRLNSSH